MATLIYDSFLDDVMRGNIDVDSDTFKLMLVGSSYTANKGSHTKRSDITGEVSNSGTYTAGGTPVVATVTKDTGLHKVTISFAAATFTGFTGSPRGCVIYKSRGGISSADELVCYGDFGSDMVATNGTFVATNSTPISYPN